MRDAIMKQARNDAERQVMGHAIDLVERAKSTNTIQISPFLSPGEQQLYDIAINTLEGLTVQKYGGYEGAERQCIAIWPEDCDWYEPVFEMKAFHVIPKDAEGLEHRDYLGSILGLGIKRDVCGDIILHQEGAYIIVDEKIADFIYTNLVSISTEKITLEEVPLNDLAISEPEFEMMTITVMSLRLDSVIAKTFQLSRGVAANFIRQGKVKVDHRQQVSASTIVVEGNVISCRGRGRCVVLKDLGKTRKGKIRLEIGFPSM